MPWDQVMHKWKAGTLQSGGSGKPVRSRQQAIAIMLSEKRKAASHPEYAATPPVGFAKGGVTGTGMNMLENLDVPLDQVRLPLEDGGTTDDSQVQQDDTPTATVRAMYYGAAFGEHNRDANYGPAGNPLGERDVAISPSLARDMGWQLGDWIEAYGQPYRIADWSYKAPGEPTHNVVEFRDHPADGHVTIKPWTGPVPEGPTLSRMQPPEDSGPPGMPGGLMAPMPAPSIGMEGMQAAAPDIQDPFSSTLSSTIAQAPQLAGDMTAGAAEFGQTDDIAAEAADPDEVANNYLMKQGKVNIDWHNAHPIGQNADGSAILWSNGVWVGKDGAARYVDKGTGQQYIIPPGGTSWTSVKPQTVKSASGDQYQRTGPNSFQALNLPGEVTQQQISQIKPGDINTVPVGLRSIVQAYADNRLQLPQRISGANQKIMAAITAYDPNYDAAKYKARQNLLTDISGSGKFGSNLVSFDTAMDHAAQLLEDSKNLGWGNSKLINKGKELGYAAGMGGHDPTVPVNTTVDILAPEAARAMSGAAPDQTEINSWKSKLSANAGFQRNSDSVIEIAKALDKKAGEINARYKNTFGTDAKVISDQTLDALHKIYDITKSPEIARIIKKYEPTRGQPYIVDHANSKGFQELAAPPQATQSTQAPDVPNG